MSEKGEKQKMEKYGEEEGGTTIVFEEHHTPFVECACVLLNQRSFPSLR